LKSSILQTSIEIKQQANPEVAKVLEELGLKLVEDGYVKWRPDASAHPRNWTSSRKAFDTGLVLLLDLFTWVTQSDHSGSMLNFLRTAVSTAGVRSLDTL
jgi:hypothetical protein